ncbi:hypothetical protein BD779DRAFT_1477015 [Infundibulicybe gibba]|nr:hypothetical protein BD779DRAFT_1477015 [Infundibulicybe gibba]
MRNIGISSQKHSIDLGKIRKPMLIQSSEEGADCLVPLHFKKSSEIGLEPNILFIKMTHTNQLVEYKHTTQSFEALTKAIHAAGEALQRLGATPLPYPSLTLGNNIAGELMEVATGPTARAPNSVPESRPLSPADSVTAHSEMSTDWDREFGGNPIAMIKSSGSGFNCSSLNMVTQERSQCPSIQFPQQTIGIWSLWATRQECFVEHKHNITANVSGIPGGCVERYPSQELAEVAYIAALDAGLVVQVEIHITRRVVNRV